MMMSSTIIFEYDEDDGLVINGDEIVITDATTLEFILDDFMEKKFIGYMVDNVGGIVRRKNLWDSVFTFYNILWEREQKVKEKNTKMMKEFFGDEPIDPTSKPSVNHMHGFMNMLIKMNGADPENMPNFVDMTDMGLPCVFTIDTHPHQCLRIKKVVSEGKYWRIVMEKKPKIMDTIEFVWDDMGGLMNSRDIVVPNISEMKIIVGDYMEQKTLVTGTITDGPHALRYMFAKIIFDMYDSCWKIEQDARAKNISDLPYRFTIDTNPLKCLRLKAVVKEGLNWRAIMEKKPE